MSFTKNYYIRCDGCGVFCVPADERVLLGCLSYDPPEPHEPEHFCKKCASKLRSAWAVKFARGFRRGDAVKSKAEIELAAEANLEWVYSTGLVDTRTGRTIHYEYILSAEKHFYEPYVGYKKNHPEWKEFGPFDSPAPVNEMEKPNARDF